MKKTGAVILAGGKGTRFHGQKQFFNLMGRPLWQYTYDKVKKVLKNENLVVVGIDIPGGDTRTFSVINGLKKLDADTDRVLIAEAARPLVTEDQLKILLEDEHPSVSFVMPLVYTVIKRDGSYLNRNELYELLTPQAFDYKLLTSAFDSGQFTDMTDETRVMYEYHQIQPFLIETTENLIKVTYQKDIAVIEQLIKADENKGGFQL